MNCSGMCLIWSTIGVYTCCTATLPLFDLALSFPLTRFLAYVNAAVLSVCSNNIACSTVELRPVVLFKAGRQSGFANKIELSASSLIKGGHLSAWLAAISAGKTARMACLLWALWWSFTMPYKLM